MRARQSGDRVLATVLFTDIVGSTVRAAELGDRRWRELVARHHKIVRGRLKRFHGREIDTAGDGFLATFERPAQAIECALETIAAMRPLGLQIRAGIHAGELEFSRGRVGGIAVHTAARVVGLAAPDEVMVTATIRDLVAGSEIEFEDRGATELKGVPGEWRLFAVVAPADAALAATGIEGATEAASRTRRDRLSRAWALIGLAAVVALLAIVGAVALPTILPSNVVPGPNTVARVSAGGAGFDRVEVVGSQPVGVVAGAGALWTINFGAETLTRVEVTAGEPPRHFSIGGAPTGIAFGPDAVWITTGFGLSSGGTGEVVRFSPSLDSVEGRIAAGNGIGAVTVGEGAVWVADGVGEVLLKIDPATQTIEHELPVARSPAAVATAAGSVWVTSGLDGLLQRFHPTSYETLAQIAVQSPTSIAVAPDAIWLTSEASDSLTRVNPMTNTVAATYSSIGDGPRGVAVTDDAVWVALGQAESVIRVDPATGEVEATLEVGGFPDAVCVDEGGRVWVTVRAP